MNKPLVYIIILNWNGYKDTIECVQSLKKISYKNHIIVIVDNGSENKSVVVLQKTFPDIKIIQNNSNLGFSGGCNVGIAHALEHGSDYVLLLNNDTIVEKDFLSEMIKVGEEDKKIGILSPLILYNNSNTISSSGGYISYKSPYPFSDPYFKMKNKFLKNNLYVDTVIGCSTLIKKDVFKKIGLYNDSYFLYAEDMDFSIRAQNAGYLLCTVVTSKVWHKVSGSSGGEGNIRKEYYNTRNLIHFAKDNLDLKKRIIFNFYFALGRLDYMYKSIRNKKYKKAYGTLLGLFHGLVGVRGYFNIH